jgi:alkanesulfonate monooxygenase SsuD/methylene tetrahydromethanopterin reductase-like flavin-dependent oxidoreductase (luciferase family)
MARLVSRWADEFNTTSGPPSSVRERYERVRAQLDADGRDQSTLTTSLMTWCYVGETEADATRRIELARERGMRTSKFEDELAKLERECIVGSAQRAAERISEYAAAGVQRIMLNHELFDDLDMLEILAEQVFPKVQG